MNPRTRALLLLLLAAVVLWISSEKLLYFRDNFHTHYPVKSVTATLLSDGLPLWNPHSDGGQPLAGNPNTLTFYPTTALYLLFPSHIAFNLHFVIHLVIAWFGMRWLLEQYDVAHDDAARVAWIYLFSGTTVSCLIFYNLIVAATWMPWALGYLIRLLRRPAIREGLLLGTCCGLIGLAAEPVVVIGFALLALTLFVSRFSKAALLPLLAALLVAVVIASPQLLAFSEVANDTERAQFRFSSRSVLAASLGPDRLAEIVAGPIYGSLLDHSRMGYWANQQDRLFQPFFLSIMLSSLTIVSALRRPGRELLPLYLSAVLFLLLGMGHYNPLIQWAVKNFPEVAFLRYPEKLALHITLIGAVLIGLFLRDLKTQSFRLAAWSFILIAGVTVTAVLLQTSLTGPVQLRIAATATMQAFVVAPLALGIRIRHMNSLLSFLALVPLGYWAAMIIPLDDSTYYTTPSPVADAVDKEVIEVSPLPGGWLPGEIRDPKRLYRLYAFRLSPGIGMVHGASYALSGSPEGMHSYLSRLSFERYSSTELPVQLRYLRIAGASYTVQSEPLRLPGFELRRKWYVPPREVYVYRISDTRPLLWEPSSLLRAKHANEAVRMIESLETDPGETSVVPAWVNEKLSPPGNSKIQLLSRSSQRMAFEVESETDTVVVVNQTWFSAWRARAGDRELVTFPADISRLGIIIPEGTTTVELEFGRRRPLIALALALSGLTMLYALGLVIVSSRRTAEPAR